MKKLVGISLFSFMFLAVSCQKEVCSNAKMESTSETTPPTWRKATSSPDGNTDSGSTSTGTGTGITDPNNDPDMNSKKGNKQ